jgi:drug/metabolite transporter (DMT)-like permease
LFKSKNKFKTFALGEAVTSLTVRPNSLSWFLLIVLSLVWGSSFILMKQGLKAFSSDEVAALRISIAFVFLSPLLFLYYKKIDLKASWKGLILMGFFGNFIPAFLFTKAETQISSSLTGMLNALTPLFTILVGVIVYRTTILRFQVVGVIVGLLGAFMLLSFGESSEESKNLSYSMLVVLATLCYAISLNGIKKYLAGINSVIASVWAFTFIGPLALIYLFGKTDFLEHFNSEAGPAAFGYTCILAVAGTALSVIAFNTLIKQAGTVFASSCTYLIPVVAIGWGLYDGETVTAFQLISIGIIIGGLWLLNKK